MAENYGSVLPATGDTQRTLLGKILRSMVGGGSGGLLVDAVTSGAGAPTHTPTIANQLYFNTVDSVGWEWFNGSWH